MKLSAEQKKVLVDALVYNYKHCANEYDLAMFEKKNVLQKKNVWPKKLNVQKLPVLQKKQKNFVWKKKNGWPKMQG